MMLGSADHPLWSRVKSISPLDAEHCSARRSDAIVVYRLWLEDRFNDNGTRRYLDIPKAMWATPEGGALVALTMEA